MTASSVAPVAASGGPVHKVVVSDLIHGVTARHVLETLEEAAEDDAELVLIELSTPGGLLDSAQTMVEAILSSERPVVVYVAPAGAMAASAGFLLTIAADVAAMAPGTNTGAATPVSGTGQDLAETMQKKATSVVAAYARSLAEQRGRDPQLVEAAVTEAKSWTASEALDAGLVDLIAASEAQLLEDLDGRTVTRPDGSEVTLSTSGSSVILHEMTTKETILAFIAQPNIAALLMLVGLAGLYFEFSNPGMLFPGILGGISLLLAASALDVLPVNVVGLLLLLVGFGLLIAEAFTPAFGILGASGVLGLLLGAFFLFEEQPIPTPALRVSWGMILPVVIVLSLMVVLVGRKVVEAQRHRPATGEEGMLGKMATAKTNIADGIGKVFIHGEYWDARASEPISVGEQVKVVGIDGLTLSVERSPES